MDEKFHSAEAYTETASAKEGPNLKRPLPDAALLGVAFTGSFDDIVRLTQETAFQEAVGLAITRMTGTASIEGLIFPSQPLRIERAAAIGARAGARYQRAILERLASASEMNDFSALHAPHPLIADAVATGDESVGYILPVIVVFSGPPASNKTCTAFEALQLISYLVDSVREQIVGTGAWTFNADKRGIAPLEVLGIDYFADVCTAGLPLAIDRSVTHANETIREIMDAVDATPESVILTGLNLEIEFGAARSINFAPDWIRDECVRQSVTVKLSHMLVPEIQASRRKSATPYHSPYYGPLS